MHQLADILPKAASDVDKYGPILDALENCGVRWHFTETKLNESELADTWKGIYLPGPVALSQEPRLVFIITLSPSLFLGQVLCYMYGRVQYIGVKRY